MAQITTAQRLSSGPPDPNGNHDSGYGPSNIDDVLAVVNSPIGSPEMTATVIVNRTATCRKNGSPVRKEAPLR